MARTKNRVSDKSVPFLIYLRASQKQLFLDLREEIKDMWWKKYAESLTYRDLVIRAMISFKEKVIKEDSADAEVASKLEDMKKSKLSKYERTKF